MKITRVKKTNQVVYEIGPKDSLRTLCLFPFQTPSKKGDRGVIQAVNNSNLIRTREEEFNG